MRHSESNARSIWAPTPEQAGSSRLAAFMRAQSISTFDELLRRSVEDIEWFWNAVIRDLDIRFFARPRSRKFARLNRE